jgi:hypothetical protein
LILASRIGLAFEGKVPIELTDLRLAGRQDQVRAVTASRTVVKPTPMRLHALLIEFNLRF